ncbi:DUF488 domain-containing protein [Cohnella thailandensis]|uniref:DUF488 family protein n=1 Tax=Cohnella thailandensis TaxID=557557 RepID=A0A841SRY9_9BACL|nr:DUF488 family protein [Cohnella thailandensis]MBB6633709.1 DUF488 family protein [Cohnella thailandensis]MBP1976496.1 uncharacterized protein YeaO (DUF488 family) [Cohnella thailandensis]
MTFNARVKRIYEPADASDGARVLVDRLWPRGVAKEAAQLTLWMKEVAPSPELREWFGHRVDRFAEFQVRYREELAAPSIQPHLERLRRWAAAEGLTLLYAAKDERHNHAAVLKRHLEQE